MAESLKMVNDILLTKDRNMFDKPDMATCGKEK